MTQHHDQLVEAYLAAVARAGVDLPEHRRDDLLADLAEHIASTRAELTPETEAGIRTILDRLGDPASIVAEAWLETALPPVRRPPSPPAVGLVPARSAPVQSSAPVPGPALVAPVGGVPVTRRPGMPGWLITTIVLVVTAVLACAFAVMVMGAWLFDAGAAGA